MKIAKIKVNDLLRLNISLETREFCCSRATDVQYEKSENWWNVHFPTLLS